jgi:hypothetical protein
MNPDEHLTEEQRELLISAEYYDRLNLATAYFPTTNVGLGQEQGTADEADDQGEGQEDEEEDDENGQLSQIQQQQLLYQQMQGQEDVIDEEGEEQMDDTGVMNPD